MNENRFIKISAIFAFYLSDFDRIKSYKVIINDSCCSCIQSLPLVSLLECQEGSKDRQPHRWTGNYNRCISDGSCLRIIAKDCFRKDSKDDSLNKQTCNLITCYYNLD